MKGLPGEEDLIPLSQGVELPSGKRPRADWEWVKSGEDRSWLLLTIWEGEKHQVKNMMAAIGFPVIAIKRVAMGPLSLGRLAPGEIRPLTSKEMEYLAIPAKDFGFNPPGEIRSKRVPSPKKKYRD